MFGWNKKYIGETPVQPMIPERPRECDHKWKDFSWYDSTTYYEDNKVIRVDIYEPYVCCKCGKRDNRLLERVDIYAENYQEACAKVESFLEKYKDCMKPRAFLEDEINDFQLVDREYLKFRDIVLGYKKGS